MPAGTSKPSPADLLTAATGSATAKMRTAEPGVIASYDSATQRATVTGLLDAPATDFGRRLVLRGRG